MVVKPSQLDKEQTPPSPVQLSALAGYQKFGDYLRLKRKQFGLLQREMAERFSLTPGQYGFLERERRAPQIDELVPMFAVLVQLQGDKRLPAMQVIEATTFFRLAKAIIEKKQKKRPNVSQEEWNHIERQVIDLVDPRQHQPIHLVSGENGVTSTVVLEPPDSRRRTALKDMLKPDLSHLLERETWVQRVLTYPDRTPPIKVSVTQGGMGAGKTHALALLTQQLAERDDFFLIPYRLKHSESTTADDHLDEFLATIHADLTMRVTDETKQRSLRERIEQVLTAIRAHGQKVILLVDDSQEMFPSGEWPASWHQFFEALLREPHTAILYMMTRTWPDWDERTGRSFLEEDNLPDLSIEAGIEVWKRQGFNDVDDELLRKVCERCGQNPQAIEMLAFQYKRRGFALNWIKSKSTSVGNQRKNPNTISLEKLLASETLFSGHLDEPSRRTLQQVFSNRLSGEDVKLLECLALSPLGIPFDLAGDRLDYAAESYEKFVKTSLADLNMAASGRAAIVPLVREAMLQSLTAERKQEVEQLISYIYAYWLEEVQDFKDDAEKSALVSEMIVRYIRSRQLLKAAELFITYGWLCVTFGHVARIQRVFEETIKENRGKGETAEQEIGRLLLYYHLAAQKFSIAESDRLYQEVYDKVVEENIMLPPHTAVNILHNVMLKYLDASLFQDANQMFDASFIHRAGLNIPEVYASYLHSKSRLEARWSEHEKRNGSNNDAQQLLATCVLTLKDCITQWRLCLKNALPLQEHYYNFRLARALTDYAYRQRLSGDFIRAQDAIEESIRLKKASAALPPSLAVSLSEYSQILAVQGRNQLAEHFNGEAVQLMKYTIKKTGNTALNPELGMLLKERADIYMQQARLDEALPLLEQAVELIGERKSRQSFREKAEKQVEEIRFIVATAQDYKLDKRWFARFHDLASYDDLAWLAHAGPFSEDEQDEWNRLYPQHEKEEILDRLDALIVQSRQREFARSQEEHRVPSLWYPHIPLNEIQQRIAGFEQLRKDIELQEPGAIVRMLYLEKIDEEIMTLRKCEATALQDQDTVWKCNLALYGKPTEYEMTLALQPFCAMLLRVKQHEQAGPVAQELLTQLQSWNISPHEIASIPPLIPKQEPTVKAQSHKKRTFPHEVVQRFFQDVFDKEYRTSEWHVDIAPARDDPYVDINSRTVFLPPGTYSLDRVRELLAEEIETHAYRAMSGLRSPLALPGLGLAHYGPTEEGLANHRIQQVSMQVHGKSKNKSWMGTLRTGLASGVMTPALSFLELSVFFEKAFLVNLLSSENSDTREELFAEAREEAWIQAARAFRGVPNLHEAGCCSLKDRIYLQGYIDVTRFLETKNEECLYVGKIGIHHVDTLAELHILKPYYPHQNLALSADLLDRLSQYKVC
jgi:transcriptional regulator with XRE-family HTH domain/tetratricopeptide (TPR) repeat protein